MRCTMRDIFQQHDAGEAIGRSLHPREARAAWCIANCYSAGMGGHTLACPQGHYALEQAHACRHRSCPRCAERPRQLWADAQLARLLPCPHFHVVFTLPHELLALWEFNRERFTQLLFDSVRESLLALLGDPRHLGATPGLLMALHTWGRTLSHHPHVHALVSAGGWSHLQERWLATRSGWLLPVKPLRSLYAGKLLAALRALLEAGQLRLPPALPPAHCAALLGRLRRKHWNIEIRAPYASGRGVALYLARYAKGGPLPAERPLFLRDAQVSFEYRDHRDGRTRRLHLTAHEFIARILWHAPPKGVHTVRHAGLYATAARGHHRCAAIALSLPHAPTASRPPAMPPPPQRCPHCAMPLERLATAPAQRRREIYLQQSAHRAFGRPCTPRPRGLGTTNRSNGPPTAARELST
jgi:hypothetical protein